MFWVRKLIAGILLLFAGFAMATTVIAEYDDNGSTVVEQVLPGLNKQQLASAPGRTEPVPLAVWLIGFSLLAVAGVARHRRNK